jgi:hypothetical protein
MLKVGRQLPIHLARCASKMQRWFLSASPSEVLVDSGIWPIHMRIHKSWLFQNWSMINDVGIAKAQVGLLHVHCSRPVAMGIRPTPRAGSLPKKACVSTMHQTRFGIARNPVSNFRINHFPNPSACENCTNCHKLCSVAGNEPGAPRWPLCTVARNERGATMMTIQVTNYVQWPETNLEHHDDHCVQWPEMNVEQPWWPFKSQIVLSGQKWTWSNYDDHSSHKLCSVARNEPGSTMMTILVTNCAQWPEMNLEQPWWPF